MTTTITQTTSDEIKAGTIEETTDKPLKSPLGYMGGKSRLAKRIVERIPEHTCYVEPFCGAAWVYFTKPQSKVEILNDRDGELVNFWRVVKNHLPEFLRHIDMTLVSREQFHLESKQDPSLLTDVQRAVRYYRLQRMGFGGKVVNRTFGTGLTRPNSLNLLSVEDKLKETHRRIARTTIENLDACECIEKYDSPKTFFYIDPPYWNADFYAVSFSGRDFQRLADTLKTISGKFILSLNDTPEIRTIFSEFTIDPIETTYSLANSREVGGSRSEPRKELLIHNLESDE